MGAQVVAVILQQFFEASASDVGQFDFRFLGSARRHAAFDDVLLATAGGLDHLVDGAIKFLEKARAEFDRDGYLLSAAAISSRTA